MVTCGELEVALVPPNDGKSNDIFIGWSKDNWASPSLATSSSTVTAQPTGTLRVAKWVEDLESQRRREGGKYSPVKNKDVDISIVEETKDDENSLVKVDADLVKETGVDNSTSLLNIAIDLVKETGVTINLVGDEIEDIANKVETDKTEDNKMAVDVTESVVTSDEVPEKTVDAEKQGEEAEPKSLTESIAGEYIEEEPDMKKMSEDKPEGREHQKRLIEDTKEKKDISLGDQVKKETGRDLEQKKEVGDIKHNQRQLYPGPGISTVMKATSRTMTRTSSPGHAHLRLSFPQRTQS